MKFFVSNGVHSTLLKNSIIIIRAKSSESSLSILNCLKNMSHSKDNLKGNKVDTPVYSAWLEVLGNTSTFSPCGVSLNTPNRSYLFNCGEGLQKSLSEFKIKPSKYRDIFITYPSWKNIGGVIGTTLSLQESHVKSVSIHGHTCLGGIFNITKRIVNLKGVKLSMKLCEHKTKYSDEFLNVEFIHIKKSTGVVSKKLSPKSKSKNSEKLSIGKAHSSRNSDSANAENSKINADDSNYKNMVNHAISFIIKTEKSAGSLNFEKCMEYNVPVGPLLGKLKNGEDVKLRNGIVVRSSDVKTPDLPGVVVIIVECPSEEYLDSLLSETSFFKHETEDTEYYSCTVVHFSTSEIVKSEKYQEWLNRFAKGTKHVFVNESTEIGGFIGIHRHQFKLNMVHEQIFPILHNLGIPDFPRAENSAPDKGHVKVNNECTFHDKNSSLQIFSDKIFYKCKDNTNINGETLCEVVLKPRKNYDYSKCLTLKKNEYLQEVLTASDFADKLSLLQKKIPEVKNESLSKKDLYPKIVFLGTGSKKPSKTRNSSGILVFLDEKKSIILDCGEGFYFQMQAFFGPEKTGEILRNLQAVFVSHLHVDHHMGLTTIIQNRKIAFNQIKSQEKTMENSNEKSFKPLNVIAPIQLLPLLRFVKSEIFDISSLYNMIPSTVFMESSTDDKVNKILTDLNLKSLQTVVVDHAPSSFGISIHHLDGWKITYSGDTRPCDGLIEIGKDSDVLIHEATFDDIYETEAYEKLHSTTGQAILVGRKMNAKFILLTHFSQRYCHLPVIKNELLFMNNVGIAFDFMQVSPYQLPILPYLYEPLKLVFTAYQEKLEMQETMLKLKRERNKDFNRFLPQSDCIPIKVPKIIES